MHALKDTTYKYFQYGYKRAIKKWISVRMCKYFSHTPFLGEKKKSVRVSVIYHLSSHKA